MAEDKKTNYLPDEEKEKFLEFLNDQVTKHPVVKNHHPHWKELIEWADNGNQYCEFEGGTMIDVRPLLRKRKRHIVINLMKPLIEAIDGKLNMMQSLIGTPNSSEMGDIEGAQVATKVLSHNDYINSVDNLFEDFKYDLTRTGLAWFKWIWDTGGSGLIKHETKDGKIESVEQEGEVIGYVPSVFNIRQDPTAKDREHMRWLIEIDEVTKDDILKNFPKVTKEDLDKSGQSFSSGSKREGMNESEKDKSPDETTYLVKYYWEKKTDKYPSGRYIIAIGNIVLYKGPNPALGEIPYFCAYFKRLGNSFYGTGPLHHVQEIQRAYNRTKSMTMEHIEGWRAKMAVPPGALPKEGSFTSDSFEFVEVDTNRGPVQPLTMPELSPQVNAFSDFLAGAFNTVSNVHEVSYSQLPQYSSRAPASLYSMMLEQENLKIDPLVKRLNKMLIVMGKFRLRLIDKYYTQPRLIKVVGKGREASIKYFKGSDLNGNYDVKLSIGISLHQSAVVQQRLLLELKDTGVIQDNNKILKLLNLGSVEEELRGDIADETRAIGENQAFADDTYSKPKEKGGVFVYKHDNHEVHMDYHTNFIKTDEAQSWPVERWAALDAHIEEHYVYIQMLMQTMAGAPGAAPLPSGGSAPSAETMAEGAPTTPEVAAERSMITV
jgi:hypothetical protein